MNPDAPLVRCGGCGDAPAAGRPLRRGRCDRCYDAWVRARPIGFGASCACCEDRRRIHLRYFEIGLQTNVPGGRWVVLCHNCVAFAESLKPPARSIEGLKMPLRRDRRWGDRRAEAVGRAAAREGGVERRGHDRRVSLRGVLDGTDLLIEEPVEEEQVIEMEADYEILELTDSIVSDLEEVTGIHFRINPPAE